MAHATPGHFIWYDHLGFDKDAATAFYSLVFGWTSQPIGHGYTTFTGTEGPMAGTYALPPNARSTGARPHWAANVQVADVDAAVARLERLGGSVLTPPSDFANVGRLATVADPHGASFNLFAPRNPWDIHDRTKPGEFAWSELMTPDPSSSLAFYAEILGWTKARDIDMGSSGTYVVFGAGGTDLGGMCPIPAGRSTPAYWLYYVEVSNIELAIARARSKGGKLLQGPEPIVGGARIAQLLDPEGAVFAMHQRG